MFAGAHFGMAVWSGRRTKVVPVRPAKRSHRRLLRLLPSIEQSLQAIHRLHGQQSFRQIGNTNIHLIVIIAIIRMYRIDTTVTLRHRLLTATPRTVTAPAQIRHRYFLLRLESRWSARAGARQFTEGSGAHKWSCTTGGLFTYSSTGI